MPDDETQLAPGWQAIEDAFLRLHPGAAPVRTGTSGGEPRNSVVWAVDAYPGEDYWHLVTVGLSELWEKQSPNAAISGWGFELTMRVPRPAGDREPPGWAVNLVKVVGDSVYRTGKPLAEGSRLDIGAPITGRILSRLEALALTPDPMLPHLDTPNGRVEFLQVVGITRSELERMQVSSTAAVVEDLRAGNPSLLTDPMR